jgi:hygromycin-B 7''-O-kinase
MARLPQASDPVFFDRHFRADHAAWRGAALEVCAAHGLEGERVRAIDDGSNLVAVVDDRWVVKIFPRFHQHQWESERRGLGQLQGERLPLRVPELIAQGTREDGWPYVILGKLNGTSLETCWHEFSAVERVRALERIGATMAAVHGVPLGELGTLPPEWDVFMREQKERCRRRHAELGVPAWFEQGIDALLNSWSPQHSTADRVLLTGEYTPFNLLAERDASVLELRASSTL